MPAAWFWGLTEARVSWARRIWPANPQGELLLFLQVETIEGVRNINEILSVPGIGVLVRRSERSVVVPRRSTGSARTRGGDLGPCWARAKAKKYSARHHGHPTDVLSRLNQGFRIVSLPSGGLEAPMDATLKLARTVIGR